MKIRSQIMQNLKSGRTVKVSDLFSSVTIVIQESNG